MNTAAREDITVDADPAMLMARQSLYRFAALSLLDPQVGAWERLDALRTDPILAQAAALIRDVPEAVPEELGLGEQPLGGLDPDRVLARLPDSRQGLNDQYESRFGLLVSNACPPYETEYINSKFSFQRSNALADVSGFYRAFGLSISEECHERPDHIVLELEFMATAIGLQRQATMDNPDTPDERVQICREAQGRFLREHLAWWVPAFTRLLLRENPSGFYGAVGEFLAALIPVERALLGVESASQPVTPSSEEPSEACEGCQLIV